eukprot:TRINITY_DN5686_c0_g1_i1.p1 TRINITY_DN5686_c0_g1~~TRINITY_DN5686_c0_g1_i1.p1  ORF type:complete len:643 (-),score=134.81 TRINITY_DN5686_c0_g1_i1:180-2108(-)
MLGRMNTNTMPLEEELTLLFSFYENGGERNATNLAYENISEIHSRCKTLLERDYEIAVINNHGSKLCSSYPAEIYVPLRTLSSSNASTPRTAHTPRDCSGESPESPLSQFFDFGDGFCLEGVSGEKDAQQQRQEREKERERETRKNPTKLGRSLSDGDGEEPKRGAGHGRSRQEADTVPEDGVQSHAETWHDVESLFSQSRFARVRRRFVVPVILWKSSFVCRSSTLAMKADVWFSTSYNQAEVPRESKSAQKLRTCDADGVGEEENGESEDSLIGGVRALDIALLESLGIRYICDLMVEGRKKKSMMTMCSSEKVDSRNRYAEFVLATLPYPGCEFFKQFKDSHHQGTGLQVDWSTLPNVDDDVRIEIRAPPGDEVTSHIPVRLGHYREWNILTLTQNYLRTLLHLLVSDQSPQAGLLIHCISGWDRTPLFTSLLRLSLWADGEIHRSLGPEEILYLTIAYDWFLFCHHLSDRKKKGEDILYFCFHMLDFVSEDMFSVGAVSAAGCSSAPTSEDDLGTSPVSSFTYLSSSPSDGVDMSFANVRSRPSPPSSAFSSPATSSRSFAPFSSTPISSSIAIGGCRENTNSACIAGSFGSFEEVMAIPPPESSRAKKLQAVSSLFRRHYGHSDMQASSTSWYSGWF